MSGGETDLARLLAELDPVLDPTEYAFVERPAGETAPADPMPLACLVEEEGLTLILPAAAAAARGWEARFRCRRITLRVHSALEAVGLLATVAGWLADAGIAANTVSAVRHDHLFVPLERATEALAVLERGSRAARVDGP